jgi:hypothetical protein
MLVAAGFCILFCVGASVGFRWGHLSGIVAYLAAVLPAIPIMGALAGTGVYLAEEKDEFQRALLIQSLLGGIGLTLAATTVWGFLEDFTHAPHVSLVWIYPIFWLFTVLSMPFVWMRYR